MSCQAIQTLGRIFIPAAWTSGLRLWMVVPRELLQISLNKRNPTALHEGLKIPGGGGKHNKHLFLSMLGNSSRKEKKKRGFLSSPCVYPALSKGAQIRSLLWDENTEETKPLSCAEFTQRYDVHS